MLPPPLAFSPDGKTLFAGGELWDLDADGREPGHRTGDLLLWPGMPHSLSLSADGQTLATGGFDHKVRVWDSGIASPWNG